MLDTIKGVERPALYTVMLIDTEKERPQIIRTPGGLAEWYKLIGCDLIDIQERYIDGIAYDFISDEEILLKSGGKISAVDTEGRPAFVGNIVICHCDNMGNETGLTSEDIERLTSHLVIIRTEQPIEEGRAKRWAAISGLSYEPPEE